MGCGSSRIAKQGPAHLTSVSSHAPLVLNTSAVDDEQDMQLINAHDIVFSCCICHKTFSEIYDDGNDQSGMHHEPNQPTGKIIKLYLTECTHVVCTAHLEGGGQCS